MLGSFLIDIAELYLLLEGFDLLIFCDEFVELDCFADLLVLAALQFLAQLVLGDVEVDSVGWPVALVETCRGHAIL